MPGPPMKVGVSGDLASIERRVIQRPYDNPKNLQDRFVPSADLGTMQLGGSVGGVDQTYRRFKFDRPVILRPIQNINQAIFAGAISANNFQNTIIPYPAQNTQGDNVPNQGPFFACPAQAPPSYGSINFTTGGNTAFLTTAYDDRYAIRSTKYGLLLIPTPGVWYIRNAAPLSITPGNPSILVPGSPTVQLMQIIDATDPSVMAWYMSQQGYCMAQICSAAPGVLTNAILDINVAAAIGATYVIPANLLRTGIIIQIITGTTLRMQLGVSGAPAFGGGILCSTVGQIFQFTGDANFRGPIGFYNTAATAASITYTELIE